MDHHYFEPIPFVPARARIYGALCAMVRAVGETQTATFRSADRQRRVRWHPAITRNEVSSRAFHDSLHIIAVTLSIAIGGYRGGLCNASRGGVVGPSVGPGVAGAGVRTGFGDEILRRVFALQALAKDLRPERIDPWRSTARPWRYERSGHDHCSGGSAGARRCTQAATARPRDSAGMRPCWSERCGRCKADTMFRLSCLTGGTSIPSGRRSTRPGTCEDALAAADRRFDRRLR